MIPSDVKDLVARAIDKAGSQRQLAEHLKVAKTSVRRWVQPDPPPNSGPDPLEDAPSGMTLESFIKLLDFMSGDYTRALPGYRPERDPNAYQLTVCGEVAAGLMTVAEQHLTHVDVSRAIWKDSIYFRHIAGSPVGLRVRGRSMEPHYPDGCILVCGKPAAPRDLPDYTPIIARVGDEATFKLIRGLWNAKPTTRIDLIPLNHYFLVQQYPLADVTIEFVVLGFVNPWKHGIDTRPESNTLRE